MGWIKRFNHRLFFVSVFVAVSVISGWSPGQVQADTDPCLFQINLCGAYRPLSVLRIEGGFSSFDSSTSVSFRAPEWTAQRGVHFRCSTNEGIAAPSKAMSECLNDKSLTLRIKNSLGPCDAVVSIPCIEEIFMRNSSSNWSKGIHATLEYGMRFGTREPRYGPFPQWETGIERRGNFYTFPENSTDPDALYEVNPILERGVESGKLLNPTSLDTSIRAVQELLGYSNNNVPGFFSSGAELTAENIRCNATTNNTLSPGCWRYTKNAIENQFKLVLRLPSPPQGWLTGRLFQPEIAVESVKDATAQPYRVTLVASPVPTPRIIKNYFSDVPAEANRCLLIYPGNKFCFTGSLIGAEGWRSYGTIGTDPVGYNLQFRRDPEMNIADDIVDDFQVGMTFSGKIQSNASDRCQVPNTISGFASSNAMTYSSYPIWDNSGSLNYEVAGPHFMPDKSIFRGVYSLILSKEYVKCLWGLSTPVFKASLEVIDQDGVTSNAVTVIGTDDKYVRLSATGFTFSQKTLKVKFFNTTKALNDSKKKITCVKGKTVRTITGVKPVCPKGFKIKK